MHFRCFLFLYFIVVFILRSVRRRNQWMIDRSEYVIVYVTTAIGNSAKLVKYAKKQGRTIIILANNDILV